MKDLLLRILESPAAPFREEAVQNQLEAFFTQQKIPYFRDRIGNLIVGAKNEKEYLKILATKTDEPLRVFIAHMDHPGFHGVNWISDQEPGEKFSFEWHGGSPTAHLEGAKVWIASEGQSLGEGRLVKVEMAPSGRAIAKGEIEITQPFERPKSAQSLYGGFAFRAPVWEENEILYTKAADDLVGSYVIAELARQFTRGTKLAPFIGLLTRAEEVGFIGCIAHFEMGYFKKAKRPLFFVSLETSRTLPGAEIGKGPVVRLGDKSTVFDARSLRVLTELARKALPDAHQRRVMDGGTCEGTVFTANGYPGVGISIPLGNYHNQSFQGGPDAAPENGPAPEFVHLKDVEGMLKLCQAIVKMKRKDWASPWAADLKKYRGWLKDYKKHLKPLPRS